MAKPGIMFYFDIRPCLKRLNYEEKGRLFEAMLDYGELGIEPELEGMSGIAWDFLRPGLDRDTDRYESVVLKRKYACHVKECKKNQQDIPTFQQWFTEKHHMVPHGIFGEADLPNDTQHTTYNLQHTTNNLQHTTDNAVSRPLFSPPTREALQQYCREMNYTMNVDSFMDYYDAKGWIIGKSPMQDWKAAVRRWYRKEYRNGTTELSAEWNTGDVL